MGALRLVAALLLMLAAPAAPAAASVERWSDFIAEASARFAIPEGWIRRVMAAESGGRTMLGGRPIESRAGAMGLMQLMPGTWREMRAAHGLGSDPHDPRDNILAGTAYLRAMHNRFGYPGLFAAYNVGPGAYSAWLAGRRTLPAETRAYLIAVAGDAAPGRGPNGAPEAGTPAAARGVFVIGGPRRETNAAPAASLPAGQSPLFFALGGQR